jgi:hypothetical protein
VPACPLILEVEADKRELDSVVAAVRPDDPIAVKVVLVGLGVAGGRELTRSLDEEAAAPGNA